MTLAQDITKHFNGDWRGNQGFIPTPGHSAKDRGTTVRDTDDGDVAFHSFNGGDWRALKDECRSKGLLPDRQRQPERWRVAGVYEFTDADGTVLYRTRRMEHPSRPKRFEAQRPDGRGGWIDKLGDCPRVLYRLPELLAADPAEPVYFVEGERKADKLAAWGLIATSVAFGAKGWRKSYADALAGRLVIFLPDNDQPGHEFAQKAKPDMEAAGATVHVIDLPGLPAKGDVMDWAGTAEDLRSLVSTAQRGNPLPGLCGPETWDGTHAPDREWILRDWLVCKAAGLLSGQEGVGKSLLAQQMATCLAAGIPFLGLQGQRVRALYLTCEDDVDELHRRQEPHPRRRGCRGEQERARHQG
ncbi:AAA family ATPase [Sphingobium naphthae]|nr:AAA family ATPase [Sphingobium naphthae]